MEQQPLPENDSSLKFFCWEDSSRRDGSGGWRIQMASDCSRGQLPSDGLEGESAQWNTNTNIPLNLKIKTWK